MSIIVIDPGHGGDAKVGGFSLNNARGQCGFLEKTGTLVIARRLVPALLAQRHTAILTRDRGVNLGIVARAHTARAYNVFLSIHFNGRTQGIDSLPARGTQ